VDWDWHRTVGDYYGRKPHPQSKGLNVKDYATAIKMATKNRFGGHANAQEAEAF